MKLLSACLPFIAIAPLLCIGCQSETPTPIALPVPTAVPTPNVPRAQFSIAKEVAVPIDGALRMRSVSRGTRDEQIRAMGSRLPVLNKIIFLAPDYFPPGARVLPTDTKRKQGTEVINLNRAFADKKFWKNRSRRDTKLAFYALARVLAFRYEPKGAPLKVQFLVEGKRASNIGSFATRNPLKPENLVAVEANDQSRTQQSQKSK